MHVRLTFRLTALAALLTAGPVLAGDLSQTLLVDVLPEADSILPSASGYFSTPIKTYASYGPSQAKAAAPTRPAAPGQPSAVVSTTTRTENTGYLTTTRYPVSSSSYRPGYSPYYYSRYYSYTYSPWYYRSGRPYYYSYYSGLYSGLYDIRRYHYVAPYYHHSLFFPRSYYVRSYPSYFRLGLFYSGGHFSGRLRLRLR